MKPRHEIFGWIQVTIPVVVMTFYSAIISVALVFMVYSLGQEADGRGS